MGASAWSESSCSEGHTSRRDARSASSACTPSSSRSPRIAAWAYGSSGFRCSAALRSWRVGAAHACLSREHDARTRTRVFYSFAEAGQSRWQGAESEGSPTGWGRWICWHGAAAGAAHHLSCRASRTRCGGGCPACAVGASPVCQPTVSNGVCFPSSSPAPNTTQGLLWGLGSANVPGRVPVYEARFDL